jgi:hypothetical protein
MDTFDLQVKHGVFINIDVALPFDPFNEFVFIGLFDGNPFGLEFCILDVFLDSVEQVHLHQPFIGEECVCVELGKEWVCAGYPAAGCNSVGDIHELIGEELVEIFK